MHRKSVRPHAGRGILRALYSIGVGRRVHGAAPWIALGSLLACADAEHAEPRHPEVLVVVNGASTISEAIGRYYASRRRVPEGNLVRIDVPLVDPTLTTRDHETISRSVYENAVRAPIEAFLRERDALTRIEILVTTKGVPLRIAPRPDEAEPPFAERTEASVDAELALLGSGLDGTGGLAVIPNPYLSSDEPFAAWRSARPEAPLRYLVARLTGYQTDLDPDSGVPRDVKRLIDAARGGGPRGTALIDEDPGQPTRLAAANRLFLASAAATLRAAGWDVIHDVGVDLRGGVANVAAYASWGSNDTSPPPAPYYGPAVPGRFAPRALAIDFVSFNARSFSDPTPYGQSLLADLVRAGVAGAAGHVYEPTLAGVARPHLVFGAFARGAPAVEAYFRGVPYLGWTNVFVGDPLLRVAQPADPGDDRDDDGVTDALDNCLVLPNPDQRDTNEDGFGNLCDPDLDGSGRVERQRPDGQGDLARLARSAAQRLYVPDHDLDGDGETDERDLGIAQLFLGLPPGPSGRVPPPGPGQGTAPERR